MARFLDSELGDKPVALNTAGTGDAPMHSDESDEELRKYEEDYYTRVSQNVLGQLKKSKKKRKRQSELKALEVSFPNVEEDPFYQEVINRNREKKRKQQERQEATAKFDWKPEPTVQPGEKRGVTYQIQKNKGLAPKRKKEARNPRVKHRNRFESANKRIRGLRPVAKKQLGAYEGEATGIKTHVTKSISLKGS